MSQPVVKVEGARELRKALKSVEGGMEDLKATHDKIAQVVVPAGRSGAPRRTGRLAGSIRGSGTKTQAVIRAGGSRVPYGGPIHWQQVGLAETEHRRPTVADRGRAGHRAHLDRHLRRRHPEVD